MTPAFLPGIDKVPSYYLICTTIEPPFWLFYNIRDSSLLHTCVVNKGFSLQHQLCCREHDGLSTVTTYWRDNAEFPHEPQRDGGNEHGVSSTGIMAGMAMKQM